MTAAELAERLHARPTGPGRWIARCPAHPDRTPSLAIREGDGGKILLHDFAGCTTTDVLAAMGLTLRDIMGAPTPPAERARLRRQRDARQAAEVVARRRQRGQMDLLRKGDAALERLAAAASTTPGAAGDALGEQYHRLLDATREAEMADAA